MHVIRHPRAAAAAAILLSASAAAASVPQQASGSADAAVLRPLTVVKRADLDFGALVVAGAGTAVMNPVTGAITVTGSLTPAGTAGHPATFTTTGSRNSVVLVRVPNNPVTLMRVGGGGSMTVSNWTLDGSTNRRIPPNMAFDFSIGGTLNVAAGQPDGTYSGTFTVTVQYP